MPSKNSAFVVAHAAHLLVMAGMLQRLRPAILIVNRSETPTGRGQIDLIRLGLRQLQLDGHVTLLDVDESASYEWALKGELQPYKQIQGRILRWLDEVRPAEVFGDAFELTNFQHDLGRLLLDSAVADYIRRGHAVVNYEFPLCCRTSPDPDDLRFHAFPGHDHDVFELTDEEANTKERLVRWAWQYSPFIFEVAPKFPSIRREIYRRVPSARDYAAPPTGLELHYDGRGREMVRQGIHQHAISFAEHFVPLARALGSTTSLAGSSPCSC